MHRLLMWIRLRFGLFWKKSTVRILAELIGVLIVFVAASVVLGSVIRFCYELYHVRQLMELRIRQEQHTSQIERLKVAKLEQIVVNCLNHDIVLVDGKIKICEL